mmetsp:Transcript_35760/g.68597  ORF Transcript_35760/g.68597 Transcript_35760/m.68597 type:complete len:295 (+) Transcript_35760:93-977(+)|eukprot:CAMPEP_0114249466 /NCGR_PEP_ID=MMETSP0058-20121206/14157_1 /TAXON_ID=36894 /ORGANISM="Pyramimonas parkeae, CCMP726" /LENGTH=294 /DNA_ID=CAMNT_0001363013 /DNA_START=36 /DNA_END=920 /DNA_ORIENTATION=+
MTDYNKWDKIVASLSDDEDETSTVPAIVSEEENMPPEMTIKAGVGNTLAPDGTIQHLEWRPGNARGNALSTNADIQFQFDIEHYEWEEGVDKGFVTVQVPLKALGKVLQDKVRCSYTSTSFSLFIENDKREVYRLAVSNLPCGGIVPDGSSFRMETSGGKEQLSTNRVFLRLKKKDENSTWGTLGIVQKSVKRTMVTITDYSWADFKKSCKVWIKVPGVHLLPADRVKSRFRELSFDITVNDLDGKDYQFCITELPMEVLVEECYHEVLENQIKIFLKKWAKTGWFKLTNFDGR